MKKRTLCLVSSSAVLLAAASITSGVYFGVHGDSVDVKAILDQFDSGYHVSVTASETTTYPESLSGLNNTRNYAISQTYGWLSDGTSRAKAVKDADGFIHYAGEDGASVYDSLNAYNEVETFVEDYYGMDVLYSEAYREPWAYIDTDDINGETLELDRTKASFLIESYLGISRAVEEAHLVVDNNGLVTGVEISFLDRYDGLEVETGVFDDVISSFSASISYSYSDIALDYVKESTNSNPELETAFTSLGNNYTMVVSGNQFTSNLAYYVAGNSIYVSLDASLNALSDGDMLYEYNEASGRYNSYTYSLSSDTWMRGSSSALSDIIPEFSTFSTAIYYEESAGIYALVDDAIYSAPLAYIPAYYDAIFDDAIGQGAYATLANGALSSLATSFSVSGIAVNVTESFSSIGETTLPSYVSRG